jgi:hypothetical protein
VQWWNWRSRRGWEGSMRVIGSVLRKRVHGSRRVGSSTPPPVSQTKEMCWVAATGNAPTTHDSVPIAAAGSCEDSRYRVVLLAKVPIYVSCHQSPWWCSFWSLPTAPLEARRSHGQALFRSCIAWFIHYLSILHPQFGLDNDHGYSESRFLNSLASSCSCIGVALRLCSP